jgi:UBA/TS-N domain
MYLCGTLTPLHQCISTFVHRPRALLQVSMGFSHEQAAAALSAAGNNMSAAVSRLLGT